MTTSAMALKGSSVARSAARPAFDAGGRGQRVAAAGLLEAGEQRLVGGVEEEHAVMQAERREVFEDGPQGLEVVAPAHVGDDGGALDLGALVHEELDERADHLRRQVVDAEVARVLEDVHRRRLPGAGVAGDDDQVLKPRLGVRPPAVGAGLFFAGAVAAAEAQKRTRAARRAGGGGLPHVLHVLWLVGHRR